MQHFYLSMSHLLLLKLFHQLWRLQIQIIRRLLQNPAQFQRHPPLQLGLVWVILHRMEGISVAIKYNCKVI